MSNKRTKDFSFIDKLVSFSDSISKNHKKLFIGAFVSLCVIFSICFLYQPARDFYISVREQDRLNAQYEALKQANVDLQNEINFLQTEDGIKQRASDTLGLIQQGESIGYVAGTEIADGRDNSASSTSSKLAYKNIKTPTTWYSPFFNFIFGVYD